MTLAFSSGASFAVGLAAVAFAVAVAAAVSLRAVRREDRTAGAEVHHVAADLLQEAERGYFPRVVDAVGAAGASLSDVVQEVSGALTELRRYPDDSMHEPHGELLERLWRVTDELVERELAVLDNRDLRVLVQRAEALPVEGCVLEPEATEVILRTLEAIDEVDAARDAVEGVRQSAGRASPTAVGVGAVVAEARRAVERLAAARQTLRDYERDVERSVLRLRKPAGGKPIR